MITEREKPIFKCSECGKSLLVGELVQIYLPQSLGVTGHSRTHVCSKECYAKQSDSISILQERAVVISGQIGISTSIAFALANAERDLYIHTGKEVDIASFGASGIFDCNHHEIKDQMRSLLMEMPLIKMTYSESKKKPLENAPSKFIGKGKNNFKI